MIFTLSRSTPPRSRGVFHRAWLILCTLAVLSSAGCNQSEEILAYDADKPDALGATPQNRILAALIFRDDGLWTFKLVGPEAKIHDLENTFKDYLHAITFNPNGEPALPPPPDQPKWIADPKMEGRFAGFRIGPVEDNVEMTVVKLDRTKEQDLAILNNINRWRVQLKQPKISYDDAIPFFTPLKLNGIKDAVLIDLKGTGSGRTTPAGMGAKVGPKRQPAELLRGNDTVKYDKPEGWRVVQDEGDRGEFKIRRAATLEVGEGDAKAEVTIIPLGKILVNQLEAMIFQNVNRWANELELKYTEKELDERIQKIEVGPSQGYYVDFTGKHKGTAMRTLAVMVPLSDRTWFIKMMGPPDLVGKQKEAFEKFAKSVKFPGGR